MNRIKRRLWELRHPEEAEAKRRRKIERKKRQASIIDHILKIGETWKKAKG